MSGRWSYIWRFPTTAAVNDGPIIPLRDPRDNPTPEKTFISLVQGQPDQAWVEGKGRGDVHVLPPCCLPHPSTSISVKPDLEDTFYYLGLIYLFMLIY